MQALVFNGQAGDKITFRVGTLYSSIGFTVEIYSPNGTLLRSQIGRAHV